MIMKVVCFAVYTVLQDFSEAACIIITKHQLFQTVANLGFRLLDDWRPSPKTSDFSYNQVIHPAM